MNRSQGRTAALTCGALAASILAVAGIFARDALAESWYIFRLGSASENVRLAAAEKLGEMASVRALPRLMELIEQEPREEASRTPEKAAFDERANASWDYSYTLTPLAHAVYCIGPEALPALERLADFRNRGPGKPIEGTPGLGAARLYILRWILKQALLLPAARVVRVSYSPVCELFPPPWVCH